jgi:hypothetical protein
MISYPAVVVHGLEDASAALESGLPVTLLSAPGAACTAGALWWREVVKQACARHPNTPVCDVLDCADAPGRAMEALRLGQRVLVLDPACPAFAAVSGAVAACGGTLLSVRPPAVDAAPCGFTEPYARERLAAWLRCGHE